MTTIPARFHNVDEAHRRFSPLLVERFASGLTQTDERGDALASACAELPGGTGMQAVHAWLEQRGPVSSEIEALLAPLAKVPAWVDWDRLERGSIALWRGGPLTGLAFNCASLAAGYRSAAAVKPLMFTGRLIYMASRRTQETGRWMLAATSPGGMRRDSAGFKETVRVRIIHASVRRSILRSGRWDAQAWGAPINLSDTAYGIAGEFSTVPVAAMRDGGLHYTEAERDDIQHMWRYIGHLLGVPDEMLPANEAEALEIMRLKELTDTPADDDSCELVQALIEHGTPPDLIMPAPMANALGASVPRLLYGLTRRWAGERVADELRLPDTIFKYAVPAARPAVRAAEIARRAGLRDDRRIAERTLARFGDVLVAAGGHPLVSLEEAGRPVPAPA
jgi:ER-bound oxygenase mpaB/B'/Rubber oxygenase, catalytic domain